MRATKLCGENPEDCSVMRFQGHGNHDPVASPRLRVEVRNELRIELRIYERELLAAFHGLRRAVVFSHDPGALVEQRIMQAPLGDDLQSIDLRVEELNDASMALSSRSSSTSFRLRVN